MHTRKFLLVFGLSSAAFVSGCNSGLLSGEQPQAPADPVAAPAPIVVDGVRTSYADVVEKSSPAVVRIEAEAKGRGRSQTQFNLDDLFRQGPGQPQQPQRPQLERGLGSGVIVSADGTILTNNHVVEGAEKITVLLADNKTFEARLIGSDKPSDLAVLKIEAQNMPFLTLGNSDTVRVGDIVLAIGNPLGIGQTVTAGIISAKGRRTGLSYGNTNDTFEDFLQTDAPINRGNSGGALVNLNGELIGINSQILAGGPSGGNIGIGFSIPSNMAKTVMEQLLKDGRVRRGMLGVNIQNITTDTAQALELPNTSGVIVSNVRSGSSGDKAGLKRRDIIIAVNGEKIDDSNVLRNKIASTLPGTEVKLTIIRDGNTQELTAVLDEYNVDGSSTAVPQNREGEEPQAQPQSGKLGLSLQPVSPQVAKQLGLEGSDGLVVTDVDQAGPAAEAGIARGDVVLEINRTAVKSVEDVQSALERAGDRPVLMLVARRGGTVYLTVRPN
jgi:serine protease Do